MSFCNYLKEIGQVCNTCVENHTSACHINIGLQKYYEGFKLPDTIHIIRHKQGVSVETDIEVTYRTDYPYGRHAGKASEFAAEYDSKEKQMRDYLGERLPSGVQLLRSHQHYNPDSFDPNIVAIHIHAHKAIPDLDEAKVVVDQLVKVIKPREIETAIKD